MGLHTWMPVICNMSITASAVILIILPVRILLKKMPKIFSYLLWGVVLFRLLCPFSVPSPFSLLGIFEDVASDRAVMEYIPAEYLYQDDFVSSAVGEKKAGDGGFPAGHGEKTKTSALLSVLTYVWAAGVAGMLCLNGINLYRLRKRIAGAICIGENVYESDYIISPFVMGLFCPKIYMPSSLTEQERYFILLHEKSHRKRGDHIAKLLFFVALTIHWFNPLVWLAFYLAEKDMEMSCDEMVIRQTGRDIRADYSETLLRLAAGRKAVAGVPLAFGAGDIRSRIKNIMGYRKPAIIIVVLAVTVVIGAMFVLGSNPESDAKQSRHAASEEIRKPDSHRPSETAMDDGKEAGEGETVGDAVPKNPRFYVSLRSISKSSRGIDTYVPEKELTDYMAAVRNTEDNSGSGDWDGEDIFLPFAENCIFKVNQSKSGIKYKTVSFDEFAEFINVGDHDMNKPCVLEFSDGIVTEICLQSK